MLACQPYGDGPQGDGGQCLVEPCKIAPQDVEVDVEEHEGDGKDGQGEEKKNWVIMQLRSLCEKLDLVLSNEELEAINEDAYVTMKKDETN